MGEIYKNNLRLTDFPINFLLYTSLVLTLFGSLFHILMADDLIISNSNVPIIVAMAGIIGIIAYCAATKKYFLLLLSMFLGFFWFINLSMWNF